MRECLPCTACCEGWLKLEVNGESVYPGKPCVDCKQSVGCGVYENRPVEPCQSFSCGWLQEKSPLPEWFRPDNAKTIVVFNKLVWQGYPVDLAVPVGKRIPPRALNWLKQFSNKTQRPLLYMEQQPGNEQLDQVQNIVGHGPALFLEELQEKVSSGERLW